MPQRTRPKYTPRSVSPVLMSGYIDCRVQLVCQNPDGTGCAGIPNPPTSVYVAYSAVTTTGFSIDPNLVLLNPPTTASFAAGAESFNFHVQLRSIITEVTIITVSITLNGVSQTGSITLQPTQTHVATQ